MTDPIYTELFQFLLPAGVVVDVNGAKVVPIVEDLGSIDWLQDTPASSLWLQL